MFLAFSLSLIAFLPLGLESSALPPDDAASAPTAELEGLWPSPKLRNILLRRWASDMAARYELDEEQYKTLEHAIVQRWSRFMENHRATIQPLVNEFIEMRMDLTPPPEDQVADWAQRATPVFRGLREQIEGTASEFREILTPQQHSEFDARALALDVGLNLAEGKLANWREGNFNAYEFWTPPKGRQKKEGDETKKNAVAGVADANASEDQTPEDHIATEVDAWRAFVLDFAKRYELDGGQRNAALSCLTELQERALAHRDQHRVEIDRIERRIAAHDSSKAELERITLKLEELYGPIDVMFEELKYRVGRIATSQQDERVRRRQAKQSDSAKKPQ